MTPTEEIVAKALLALGATARGARVRAHAVAAHLKDALVAGSVYNALRKMAQDGLCGVVERNPRCKAYWLMAGGRKLLPKE